MADGASGGGPDITPSTQHQTETPKKSRWDFLKQIIPWRRGQDPIQKDENYVQHPLKRKALQVLAGAGGAVAVTAATGITIGAAAEKTLSKTTIDREMNINGNRIHFSAQEFKPKEGKIKDPEEVVIFLIGAPLRVSASIGWEGPESLAEQCKTKTYSVDARPIGHYSGNAIDLEVAAILEFLEPLNFKKITLVAHSVGAPKAYKLAAEIYEKKKNMQVMGVVAMNPVGHYPQDAAEIIGNYFADGVNQPNLQNPRAKHDSLFKSGPQIIGSVVKDIEDAGLSYPKLQADQVASATQVSPDLNRVHAPVVLLLASEDKVVKADKIFPKEKVQARIESAIPDSKLRAQVWKSNKWENLLEEERKERIRLMNSEKWQSYSEEQKAKKLQGLDSLTKFGSKEAFVEDYLKKYRTREQMAKAGYAKDAYAKDTYLPNSQQVRVIAANKYASHLAFNERRDMSSHVISRIFEWMGRNPPKPAQKAA